MSTHVWVKIDGFQKGLRVDDMTDIFLEPSKSWKFEVEDAEEGRGKDEVDGHLTINTVKKIIVGHGTSLWAKTAVMDQIEKLKEAGWEVDIELDENIDKVVDNMLLEEFGFPKEIIEKVTDVDAFIAEAVKAIADKDKATKILQFLGMDVTDLPADMLDKAAVALDKLIDWATKQKEPTQMDKLKADAEKRRGVKLEAKDGSEYGLSVYWKPTDEDEITDDPDVSDKKVEKAVGKKSDGSGTELGSGEHDISFTFKSKEEAEKASKAVKTVFGKRVKTSVYPLKDVGDSIESAIDNLLSEKKGKKKEDVEVNAIVDKMLAETGEMSQADIEDGGDWYESAKELERAAKEIEELTSGKVKFSEVRPFDQYQGPYASMQGGKLWLVGEDEDVGEQVVEDTYYFDGIVDVKGSTQDIVNAINDFSEDAGDEDVEEAKKKKEKAKAYGKVAVDMKGTAPKMKKDKGESAVSDLVDQMLSEDEGEEKGVNKYLFFALLKSLAGDNVETVLEKAKSLGQDISDKHFDDVVSDLENNIDDDEAVTQSLDWLSEFVMDKLDPREDRSTPRDTSKEAVKKVLAKLDPEYSEEEDDEDVEEAKKKGKEKAKDYDKVAIELKGTAPKMKKGKKESIDSAVDQMLGEDEDDARSEVGLSCQHCLAKKVTAMKDRGLTKEQITKKLLARDYAADEIKNMIAKIFKE